jgi:hypothetical protein
VTEAIVAKPRFDWYAATINVGVDRLRDTLCDELSATAAPEEGARHGFHHREAFRDLEGRTVATLLHGGNGDLPHAYASSDTADRFASIIRRHWGDAHRVSRMDAALDFDDGPSTWGRLLDLCKDIADGTRVPGDVRKRASKIRTNQMGDWHHGLKGRTFYLGAFKSAVLVRLYEKGIQLHEEAAVRNMPAPVGFSRDAVRLEVQVRPDGRSKTLAATATPEEAFGYAEWSRELLRRVSGLEMPRVDIKERRDSDHDRAMQWMVKQYGEHLLIEALEAGGWDRLGEALRRRMETGSGIPDDERPF